MSNLKNAAVAVLALSSSTVFAGTMGLACNPGNVTVPCERSAWNFEVQALYLRPTFSAADGYHFFTVDPFTGFRHYRDFDPDWGWGWKIAGSYHFNTGNDLNVNWYHMNKRTRDRIRNSFLIETAPIFFDSFGSSMRTRFEPKWDAVNVELGQHVDWSQFANVRFHGGVQYARLERRFDARLGGFGSSFLTPGFLPFGRGLNIA